MGLIGAAYIWTDLLFPTHWPILIAVIGTFMFGLKLKHRGKFFVASLFICYGMQGLAYLPSPFIWTLLYDRLYPPQELEVTYRYSLYTVSILLSLWAMRFVAVHYWHRLFPSNQSEQRMPEA